MSDDVTLYLGDCLEVMKGLPDGSVDAVVTDPPYNLGKDYDLYNDNLTREDFTKFVNSFMDQLTEMSRTILLTPGIANLDIYLKHSPRWILSWHKPFSPSHCPVGFNNWEPVLFWGKWLRKKWSDYIYAPLHLNDKQLGMHACPKPVDLAAQLIDWFSNPGDTILDPFMGSGTTGVACIQTGRKFIGIEIDPKYYAIAEKRIAEAQMQIRMLV